MAQDHAKGTQACSDATLLSSPAQPAGMSLPRGEGLPAGEARVFAPGELHSLSRPVGCLPVSMGFAFPWAGRKLPFTSGPQVHEGHWDCATHGTALRAAVSGSRPGIRCESQPESLVQLPGNGQSPCSRRPSEDTWERLQVTRKF